MAARAVRYRSCAKHERTPPRYAWCSGGLLLAAPVTTVGASAETVPRCAVPRAASVRHRGHSRRTMARDPKDDQRVYLGLGLAMSKSQLLEVALVKLVEVQRKDLSLPLDDRWAEISTWLGMTAGRLQPLLGVPEVVASEVRAAIGRRNRAAHEAWMLYSVASDSRASADTWVPWLEAEAAMLQQVVHGLARLRERLEQIGGQPCGRRRACARVAEVRVRSHRASP